MKKNVVIFGVLLFFLTESIFAQKLIFSDDFTSGMGNWTVEKFNRDVTSVDGNNSRLNVMTQSGQDGIMVWCNQPLPKNFIIEYDMTPLSSSGFFLIFFCAQGTGGSSILDNIESTYKGYTLFEKYTERNVRCYHMSYRRNTSATCNFRKNPGLNLLKQQSLSQVLSANQKIHVILQKNNGRFVLTIDGNLFMDYTDKGSVHEGGHWGIRQVYDSQGFYDNVQVWDTDLTGPTANDSTIVDNTEAGFASTSNWSTSTRDPHYGSNYLWAAMGNGSETATWTPILSQAGNYDVYIRWAASMASDRASNAPYTVTYNGGDTTLTVIQKLTNLANKWFLLGEFPFAGGSSGSGNVKLTNNADNSVSADAAMWVYKSPSNIQRGQIQQGQNSGINWFVYPTLVRDAFSVEFIPASIPYELKLYNIQGRQVLAEKIQAINSTSRTIKKIHTGHLKTGTYLLRLLNSKQSNSKKLTILN